MPMQLQLEGPDLPTLLRRVKTEAGTGARIVRAEKVRTGGVAGFFAKERYEITVEVNENAPPSLVRPPAARPSPVAASASSSRRPSPVAASAPTSLLDLADSVSDSEQAVPRVSASQVSASQVSAGPVSAAQVAVAEPEVSTESSRFASVLASLRASTAPAGPAQASPAQAGSAGSGPSAPSRSRRSTDAPRVPRQRSPQPPSPQPPSPQPPSTVVLSAAPVTTGLPLPSAAELRPPLPQVPEDTLIPVRPAPITGPAVPPDRVGVLAVAARHELELPARSTRGAVAVRPRSRPAVTHPLSALGLPCHLQPTEAGALYPALVKSLRSLPKAPRTPNKAGSVLAVVGPLPEALEAGAQLAKTMGLTAAAIVLATSYRTLTHLPERQVLRDVDEAEVRRSGMKRRRNATIVVIDAPFTADGAAQARAYLRVFAPTITWGAVEATRKSADVAAFARAIGGFDALALSAVEETADPATVLQLGIPVARLAGRPATPAAWAALLTSRLAA